MKHLYFLLFILFFLPSTSIISQTFTWIDAEETGYDLNPGMVRYSVATATDGSVWWVGMKEQITSYQDMMGDHFIIRFDSDGNRLEEFLLEGALIIRAIETDDEGNLFIGGDYYSTDVTFWDGTVLSWEDNELNGFIARITPDGEVSWALNVKEASGYFSSVLDFTYRDGIMYAAQSAWPNSFVSGIDDEGNISLIITQENVGIASGIALDSEGNIYVTGGCSGQQSLFNGVNYPSPFNYNKHLVKYNEMGEPQWIRFVEDVTCIFPRIVVDQQDHIYWSGVLYNPCVFDTIVLEGSSWVYDYFLVKFNADGHALWAREVPQVTTGDATIGLVETVGVLPDNSVLLAGITRGDLDWGNDVQTSVPPQSTGIMAIRFSPDGVAQWSKLGGGESYSNLHTVYVDTQGNAYLTGVGNGTISFDDLEIDADTFYYPFIVKLETGITTRIESGVSIDKDLLIFPNPASEKFFLPLANEGIEMVRLINMQGKQMLTAENRNEISLEGIPTGLYMVHVRKPDGRVSIGKLVVR